LQLTVKISLEFDFSSSSLLLYGPLCFRIKRARDEVEIRVRVSGNTFSAKLHSGKCTRSVIVFKFQLSSKRQNNVLKTEIQG